MIVVPRGYALFWVLFGGTLGDAVIEPRRLQIDDEAKEKLLRQVCCWD